MERSALLRRWGAGSASALALALALLGWWLLLGPEPAAPEPTVAAPVAQAPLRAPEPKPPEPAVERVDYLPDGQPIYPAGSAAPPEPRGMAPHGLTPQHLRIYRENNLVGDLNGAMDVKDVAGMRRLLQQYREEYPEDAHVLQDGYELIANCLEHPNARNRAMAQRYYDEELDSGLRRYIRRHCLED